VGDELWDTHLIELFLGGLNEEKKETYRICERPDVDDRASPAVDAIAKNQADQTLAIEHTHLQAYPGQMEDDVRFNRVFGKIMHDKALAVPGRLIRIIVPAFAVPNDPHWCAVGDAVHRWFKEVRLRLPRGQSVQPIPGLRFDLSATVETLDTTRFPSGFVYVVALRRLAHWSRLCTSPGSQSGQACRHHGREAPPVA
jgi:hypothetical protein